MEDTNSKQEYEIGMVGLGVMDRNLLLNCVYQHNIKLYSDEI
jgi:6-phosphogluconate dehydrogenase